MSINNNYNIIISILYLFYSIHYILLIKYNEIFFKHFIING